ncbi:FYVE zinc finger [Nakaseomyces glabratus]|nr:Zn finger protein [Nakaseomyces glabratus]
MSVLEREHGNGSSGSTEDPAPTGEKPDGDGPSDGHGSGRGKQQGFTSNGINKDQTRSEGKSVAFEVGDERETSQDTILGDGGMTQNGDTSGEFTDRDDTSQNRMNGSLQSEGLVFEKRKVIPQRRTQSQQSMLSSISLRSMIQEQQHVNNQQQQQQQSMHRNSMGSNNTNNDQNLISHSLLNMSQQIRSPAMFSIKRTGSLMHSASRTASNFGKQETIYDSNSLDSNEIGKKLPFTNDERIQIGSKKESPTVPRIRNEIVDNATPTALRELPEVISDLKPEDEDEISQKDLTTQALRKLSNFKGSNLNEAFSEHTTSTGTPTTNVSENEKGKIMRESSNFLVADKSSPSPMKASSEAPKKTVKLNDQSSTDTDLSRTSSSNILNFTTNSHSMMNMKFGDRNITVENNPEMTTNTHAQNFIADAKQPQVRTITKMHSLDMLQKPVRYRSNSNNPTLQKQGVNRRHAKQINDPKKPLYMPVVLRNVVETNITNDDLQEISPRLSGRTTPAANKKSPGYRTDINYAGSQKSGTSNTSSVLETYKRYISSFLFPNRQQQVTDDAISSILHKRNITPSTIGSYSSSIVSATSRSPQLPTRTHWIPDSKRSACHQCHKLFTFFDRKHHCRHCGDIYCQKHLRHWLYLDSDAKFVVGGGGVGTLSKVCDACHIEYEDLARTSLTPSVVVPNKKYGPFSNGIVTKSNLNVEMSLDSALSSGEHSKAKPIEVAGSESEDKQNKKDEPTVNSVVGSIPADWNWSSF